LLHQFFLRCSLENRVAGGVLPIANRISETVDPWPRGSKNRLLRIQLHPLETGKIHGMFLKRTYNINKKNADKNL